MHDYNLAAAATSESQESAALSIYTLTSTSAIRGAEEKTHLLWY